MQKVSTKKPGVLFSAALAGLTALASGDAGGAASNPSPAPELTGLIYQLTPHIATDVDGFLGLTRGAPNVNTFGVGVRF